MALAHKISDAVTMRIDKDMHDNPVIEIEFRYIRYRLTIDDIPKAKKLSEFIDMVTDPGDNKGEVKRPKFYKDTE